MNKFKIELNESWLNGKFKNGEINTRIPYVASDDFFAQGDDAQRIIGEIFAAWTTRNISVEQAFNEWLKNNL